MTCLRCGKPTTELKCPACGFDFTRAGRMLSLAPLRSLDRELLRREREKFEAERAAFQRQQAARLQEEEQSRQRAVEEARRKDAERRQQAAQQRADQKSAQQRAAEEGRRKEEEQQREDYVNRRQFIEMGIQESERVLRENHRVPIEECIDGLSVLLDRHLDGALTPNERSAWTDYLARRNPANPLRNPANPLRQTTNTQQSCQTPTMPQPNYRQFNSRSPYVRLRFSGDGLAANCNFEGINHLQSSLPAGYYPQLVDESDSIPTYIAVNQSGHLLTMAEFNRR